MNPANGTGAKASMNGTGNSLPLIETGKVCYTQFGYLMKKDLLGRLGTLQPYGQFTVCNYQRVESPITTYDLGVNWLHASHRSKLFLDYQSRPILAKGSGEKLIKHQTDPRKGMLVLQYQFAF